MDGRLMKTCSKCKVGFPLTRFYRNHGNQCKTCLNQQAKAWVKRNPSRRKEIADRHYHKQGTHTKREWVLRRYFNMTGERYSQMLLEQDGKCLLCSREPNGTDKRKLAVDHDHKTGKVLGLLCGECNRGLGLFREDEGILLRAIEYLRRHNGMEI
jgi:hypothetical protein